MRHDLVGVIYLGEVRAWGTWLLAELPPHRTTSVRR